MPITTTKNEDSTVISISGQFDYSIHREFRDAYKNLPQNTKIILELSQTAYLDSSALGMLLLLREHLGEEKANISITRCNPDIKRVFELSNFHTLFNIT